VVKPPAENPNMPTREGSIASWCKAPGPEFWSRAIASEPCARHYQQEPMAGGFPQLEHQIRAYRDHRGARAGRGLVSEGLGVFVKL